MTLKSKLWFGVVPTILILSCLALLGLPARPLDPNKTYIFTSQDGSKQKIQYSYGEDFAITISSKDNPNVKLLHLDFQNNKEYQTEDIKLAGFGLPNCTWQRWKKDKTIEAKCIPGNAMPVKSDSEDLYLTCRALHEKMRQNKVTIEDLTSLVYGTKKRLGDSNWLK